MRKLSRVNYHRAILPWIALIFFLNIIYLPNAHAAVREERVLPQNTILPTTIPMPPIIASPNSAGATMYDDVGLLQSKWLFDQNYLANKTEFTNYPILSFLTQIAGQIYSIKDSNDSHTKNTTSFYMEEDAAQFLSPWVTTFLALAFNNVPYYPQHSLSSTNLNGKIQIDRAYINIGNLSRTPFFATAGKIYVPFGIFNTAFLITQLPQFIGTTQGTLIEVGYAPKDNGWLANLYALQPTTEIVNSNYLIPQWGANLAYNFWSNGSIVGLSYIANIADAKFIYPRLTSVSLGGLSYPSPEIAHAVRGIDAYINLVWPRFVLRTEYTAAAQHFSANDLAYQNHGARPAAWNIEGQFNFNLFNHASFVVLGYNISTQAAALNIPQTQYSAAFFYTFVKTLTGQLEYDYRNAYPNPAPAFKIPPHENLVIAQLSVYF